MRTIEQPYAFVSESTRRIVVASFIGVSALTACGNQSIDNMPAPGVSQPEAMPTAEPGGNAGAETGIPLGFDISWPQCGSPLPEPGAFAIVGANAELPNAANPCFAEQAAWAEASTGETDQPPLAVYVTAANPAAEDVPSWPTEGATPYGACDGSDSQACAYIYGGNNMENNVETVKPYAVGDLKWLIDVEPEYSWELDTAGMQRNLAVLEGMVDTLRQQDEDVEIGFYSDPAIWQGIIGETPPNSPIYGMDNWLRGAYDPEEALAMCSSESFNGGRIDMVQFTTLGNADYPDGLDRNVSCPAARD